MSTIIEQYTHAILILSRLIMLWLVLVIHNLDKTLATKKLIPTASIV